MAGAQHTMTALDQANKDLVCAHSSSLCFRYCIFINSANLQSLLSLQIRALEDSQSQFEVLLAEKLALEKKYRRAATSSEQSPDVILGQEKQVQEMIVTIADQAREVEGLRKQLKAVEEDKLTSEIARLQFEVLMQTFQ